MIVQLPRFQVEDGGLVRKHCHALNLQLQQPVQLPVFVHPHSVEVRWVSYDITSVIKHEGEMPRQGHYRTVLVHPSRMGTHWLTNDGVEASEEASITQHAQENCYILGLRRCGNEPLLEEGQALVSVRDSSPEAKSGGCT